MSDQPSLPRHWRLMYDNKWLGAWNLVDPKTGAYLQPIVTIASVTDEEVTGEGGKKTMCRILRFVGKKTPMILTRRQGKSLASVHGEDPNLWKGKQITLWAEQRNVRGEDCRVLAIKGKSARGENLKRQLTRPEPIETFDADPQEDEQAASATREPGEDVRSSADAALLAAPAAKSCT